MKTLKVAVCGLFALALACGTLSAQRPLSIQVTPFGDITEAPPPATPPLFTNLGYSGTDNYFDGNGWLVLGPNQTQYPGDEQWVAAKFQVKKASHVTGVEVAVGWLTGSSTPYEFDLALYNDDGTGNVGTMISPVDLVNDTPVVFGTCCKLAVARFASPGISIAANTNYWVMVTTDASATDFAGAWAFSNLGLDAFNELAAGWSGTAGNGGGNGAMEVLGTVP